MKSAFGMDSSTFQPNDFAAPSKEAKNSDSPGLSEGREKPRKTGVLTQYAVRRQSDVEADVAAWKTVGKRDHSR
jgi:hypothetical protein